LNWYIEGLWLDSQIRFPEEVGDFSLFLSVQTGSEAQTASKAMSIGGSFPGVKRLGRKTDHSPPTSAEVKNDEAIPPLPHNPPWRGAQFINTGTNLLLSFNDYLSIKTVSQ
jgi:hypothetical protein